MGRQRRELVDGHRRGRTESRAYRQRACDGKAAKGAADGHRRGRVESRRYHRWLCADTSALVPLMADRG